MISVRDESGEGEGAISYNLAENYPGKDPFLRPSGNRMKLFAGSTCLTRFPSNDFQSEGRLLLIYPSDSMKQSAQRVLGRPGATVFFVSGLIAIRRRALSGLAFYF